MRQRRWTKRGWAGRRAGAPARAAGVALACWLGAITPGLAQADKGIISERIDRLQGAQAQQAAQQKAAIEPWSPAKIVINLDARCPVVTALGYFGAFATADADPAKAVELQSRYAELQKTAQPIADELKKMAVGNTFVGPKFPDALSQRLEVLCGTLYGEVLKLYGDAGLAELKQYVAEQSQGLVMK
jgi:hypothetical protein